MLTMPPDIEVCRHISCTNSLLTPKATAYKSARYRKAFFQVVAFGYIFLCHPTWLPSDHA